MFHVSEVGPYVFQGPSIPGEARGTPKSVLRSHREEKSGKSRFMPVEITGALVRAEKGIVGRIVFWGVARGGPSCVGVCKDGAVLFASIFLPI